jgi:hypothetical protein
LKIVRLLDRSSEFAEDKDVAAEIRETDIKPSLIKGEKVRLDFRGIDGATQSFVHAMISELIRIQGAAILDRIEFKGCNPTVRSVIEIVVEYSQLGEGDAT